MTIALEYITGYLLFYYFFTRTKIGIYICHTIFALICFIVFVFKILFRVLKHLCVASFCSIALTILNIQKSHINRKLARYAKREEKNNIKEKNT